MEGRNKRNLIVRLDLVSQGVLELPVCVVDEHDDAGSDGVILDEKLFFFLKMVLPENLDQFLQRATLLDL